MATYVNNLRLKEIATGDESGTWGDSTNTNLELIGQALGYGTEAITTNADTHATTIADGAADEGRALMLKYTGTLDSTCTITLGPNTVKKVWIIENATSGSQSIIIKQGSGATVTIGDGRTAIVYSDGAGSGAAVVDALTDLTITDTLTVAGTTITIGDATAEDTKLVFDGAAQDYYMGLDDSADDLVIGLGSAVGTTPAIEIDENQDIKFAQSIGVGQAASSTTGDIVAQTMALKGTTPTLTIGDAGAEDTKIVFDGNAKDFHIGLDDSADTLVIGDGSTLGTNPILTLTDDSVTIGDGAAVDTKIVYDGNAKDFYIGLDDSADKLVIGEGSTVGTNNILTITDDTVTLGDAAAVDTALIFDGNAQDFHIALDDSADDLVVGVGSTVGSNTAFAVDENSKTTFSGASQFNSTVTVGVDDTGYDVKLFGATASKYMLWDESADSLIVKDIVDAVNYKVNGGQGSDGQVLTSTGSGVAWEDAASGGGPTYKTFGTDSIMVGDDSTGTISGANYNTALGVDVFAALTSGTINTAVGYQALTALTTANGNTGIGRKALAADTSGANNTAVGADALIANTTGSQNVAIGVVALDANTTANNNIAVGYQALTANTTGTPNIGIGYGAGKAITTGGHNVCIGNEAGQAITTASQTTCIGNSAGYAASAALESLFVGYAAGVAVTTADDSTLVGWYVAPTLTTGHQNTIVGASADVSASGGTKQNVFGWDVTASGDNTFTFGAQSTDTTCTNGSTTWSNPSDVRLKEDIQDEVVGLDFINQLRPVTFRWKKEKDVPEDMITYKADSEERVMDGKYNHGFIAQEVKEVIDNTPNIKEGFDMWSEDDADGRQRIGESALIPMLTKAIQELSAKVEDLEDKLNK